VDVSVLDCVENNVLLFARMIHIKHLKTLLRFYLELKMKKMLYFIKLSAQENIFLKLRD
jgi:hypothetical protein